MSTYDKIAWLPLCGGLTGLGRAQLPRHAAARDGFWPARGGLSLLPLAAYLTGAIEMFWKMGVAIGDFATGFVFSPRVWSGIAVTGVAALLFVVSGPLRRWSVRRSKGAGRRARRRCRQRPAVTGAGQLATRPVAPRTAPVKARKGKSAGDDDDDLGDVEDILRRHGIS